jgi:hypothetical protein
MSAALLTERRLEAINERATVGVGALTADVLELIDSHREASVLLVQQEAIIRRLRDAGNPLSNCAYNLAQREVLTQGDRESLRECYRRWDAAVVKP